MYLLLERKGIGLIIHPVPFLPHKPQAGFGLLKRVFPVTGIFGFLLYLLPETRSLQFLYCRTPGNQLPYLPLKIRILPFHQSLRSKENMILAIGNQLCKRYQHSKRNQQICHFFSHRPNHKHHIYYIGSKQNHLPANCRKMLPRCSHKDCSRNNNKNKHYNINTYCCNNGRQ